jgi:sugar/nucleoside kinase (ribokinase family)
VTTLSEKGAVIAAGKEQVSVPAHPMGTVIDTTGAGDLYAAGFLFGLANNKPLAECGHIGAVAAGEVISHYGPRPLQKLAALI